MVKEIARYGGAQVQLATNLIHHRASSKGYLLARAKCC